MLVDRENFVKECDFRTSRSSGAGGQNVNKVETRVELLFDVHSSTLFSAEQKQLLMAKLATRINDEGILQVSSSKERSQLKNKEHAVDKAIELIVKALTPRKPRLATKPTRQSVEKRLTVKSQQSEKKKNRKELPTDDY